MTGDRFEIWLRSLSSVATRRQAVSGLAAVVAGAAISVSPLHNADAAARSRKKRKGKPCRNKRDGAACDRGGQCLNGKCNHRPDCAEAGTICNDGQFGCCSDICVAILGQPSGFCAPGEADAKCRVDGDCTSGQCVGFRCRG